ncbi:hypothetical protein MMC22_007254 [Lobaria immixta]|nr:hypothetical protein [Lobaria immixta]
MSLLKRCQFTLKDSRGFERLTLKLVECIENLDKMCSWQLALTIHRGVLQVLDEEKDPRALASLSESASEMSRVKEEAGERHADYDLFASITAFKAKLGSRDRVGTVRSYTTSDFSYGKSAWEISDGDATMAIRRKNSQDAGVRLIEWYNYEGSATSRSLIERGILELAKVLCIAERPREFRTLTCAGLIPDHANSRYGFVFVPPDYIENITKFPLQVGALSKNRKPISLLELYEKNVDSKGAPGILDLGIRFQLAKKIIHSIYVMHAVGLGCVLLELGFYEPLRSFDDGYSPEVFHTRLLDLADELVGRMGSIYAGAVKDCLSIDIGTRQQSENEAQRTLCWKVAAALDQCIA